MLGRQTVFWSSEASIISRLVMGCPGAETGLKSGCDAYIISVQTQFISTGVDMGNPGQSGAEMKEGEVYYETG
jgi:hypothetical protein